jgi:hypothetical protein
MNTTHPNSTPAASELRAARPEQTLRRLFLTLFLRGRGARGMTKDGVPASVGRKLFFTLAFYALFGCIALVLLRQPVFLLSAYLHAMTFVFLGMFVAASAGEILFNSEEADILLHRPVTPRALLWAKVWVLAEVSLWLAGSFNLVGLFVGVSAPDGGWLFPLVHIVSTLLEAVFCTGCVVLVYQLCLRWFGRQRLEGIMVTAQVIVSVAAVLSGQILPQLVFRAGRLADVGERSWWMVLLPPAWFAGVNDALAGSGARESWLLAGLAVLGTGLVLWLAFEKLARDYGAGLQALGETISRQPRKPSQRWINALTDRPPLRWWLRDPVVRSSFVLTTAYLARDRDVKLRVYPSLAPFLIFPVIFLMNPDGGEAAAGGGFGIAFAGGYLGLVPLLGVSMMRYSQRWQAADIFRCAPIAGPAQLCHGVRRAVLCWLTLPLVLMFGVVCWLMQGNSAPLLMLLPGVIALPIFALVPTLRGEAVPLSQPGDEAKSVGRGLTMMAAVMISMAISGLAMLAWWGGWFWWFVGIESIVVVGLHWLMCKQLEKARWSSLE